MKNLFSIFLVAFVLVFSFAGFVMSVAPNGANSVVAGPSTSAPADTPDSNNAYAGNITELTITGYSSTQSWQGYFGNVSGVIQLADGNRHVLYNWSLTNPSGEVYASTANNVTWASVACFNVASNGDALDTSYGIQSGDADSVNETFAAKNHDEFYTNNIQFSANQCNSVELYDSTGAGASGDFQEVLLTDGTNPIFASLLKKAGADGFDQNNHDFEMLVLENGHGTDTNTTPYYFYVELQ